MTAIVSGNTFGLTSTSLNTLGAIGKAAMGTAGENVAVNIANGNLVVQRQDDLLVARGPDLALLRTYNSQALTDGDNNDNWRIGFYRQVYALTGAVNTAGSTVTRVDGDGAELVYAWDSTQALYVNTDGDGSHDTLSYDSNAIQWTWTEGSSRVREAYDWTSGSGKLLWQEDASGNRITYSYNGSLLTRVTSANSSTANVVTRYVYDAAGKSQLRFVIDGLGQPPDQHHGRAG